MTYTVGSSILSADYNSYTTTVNNIFGTGSGNTGWGQATAGLNTGRVVTDAITAANEWATLLTRSLVISDHLNQNINIGIDAGVTTPITGNSVVIMSDLPTDITTLNNVRGAGSRATLNNPNTINQSSATLWNNTQTFAFEISFATNENLRFWINCGGGFGVSSTITAPIGAKGIEWASLVATGVGTASWRGGFGITSTARTGSFILGGSQLRWDQLTDNTENIVLQINENTTTPAYSGNYFRITINPFIKASTLKLRVTCTWVDAYALAVDDNVGGTLAVSTIHYEPITTFIANSWGTVTFTRTTSLL